MSSIQEARDILFSMDKVWEKKEKTALLMITKVQGSAYRQPGAKMMISLDGEMYGTLSGGCLESDLFSWAEKAINQQNALTVQYDLSENELWSLGIGCKGSLEILILPMDPTDTFWSTTKEMLQADQPHTLIIESPHGIRVLVDQGGNVVCGNEKDLPHEVLQLGINGMKQRTRAEVITNKNRRFVMDTLRPNEQLIICGAGHDAIPLVHLADRVGFNVTVLDPRAEFNNQRRFPMAKAKHVLVDPENADPADFLNWWWIIMNHHQHRDEMSLSLALKSQARFIGVLGPLSRTQEMLSNIGSHLSSGPIHAPIGLDLGAEIIDEVAVSIVSELLAVRNGKRAEPLHGRKKIHI